jgi:hypothetical protein
MSVRFIGVHLRGVYFIEYASYGRESLMGMCLMGLYPMSVHLMGMHLTGVHLMGMHLTGVHLMGMRLMGVHLTGMHHGRVPHERACHACVS